MNWRREQRIRRYGPWVIFMVVVAAAYGLHWMGNIPGRSFAFAEAEEIAVSALYRGRITAVIVQPGQQVKKGQVVARLDTSSVEGEIEVLQAEISQLEAEAESGRLDAKRSQLLDSEQFETAVEKARLSLTREEAGLQKVKAEAIVVNSEVKRLRRLVKQGLSTREELADLEARHATLQREVKERPNALRLLRSQLNKALNRANAAEEESVGLVSTALNSKLEVARRQLEGLGKQRKGMTLYSPVDGNITMLHGMVGEVVNPGDPVIGLVASQSSRVIACVSEDEALKVKEGGLATLQIRGDNTRKLSGHVIALGPLIREVPIRCRSIPNRPAWGRQVTLQLDESATLIPGQSLTVQFELGSRSGEVVASMQRDVGSSLSLMEVPDSLTHLSRLEPSGLIWRPELARYLVVSDDTGHKGNREHSPWLFSMSAAGRLDFRPIPIMGVDALNDIESIASDGNNGLYLLTSQSYSRDEKRPKSRTSMVLIEKSGTFFQAKAVQSLAENLEAMGSKFLASLGLGNGTRDLEIEAMTFYQGSLYLGLKSPLDAEGNAMIWKMNKPKEFLESGDILQGALSLWGTIRLPAKTEGKSVRGGISELLFLPAGGLLISSTPSMGGGVMQTGYLSFAKNPEGGLMSAKTVREFNGHKPEGLSLSPTPGQVMVVFDGGEETPSWIEVPWPN